MNIDAHGLAGAYAVDALDDVERAAFETHLETCTECRQEVESLRLAAAELSLISRTDPPPELKAAVMTSIRSVRPLPPITTPGPDPSASGHGGVTPLDSRRWTRPMGWLAAAAAAVALVIGGLAWSPWSNDTPQLTVAERILQAGDAQTVQQQVGSATARIVVSRSVGRAVIITDDMPEAPPSKDYQLWFQRPDGSMVNAGLMPHTSAEHSEVVLSGDATTAVGVGITQEPRGGSPEPTGDPLVLFDLPA